MDTLLFSEFTPAAAGITFFLIILLFHWLGHKYRRIKSSKFPGGEKTGLGVAEGSLIGLTALLLAFSFGMTASKFERRREIIVEEANDIGTAILRCDLYPDSLRREFLKDFSQYIDERIAYYDAVDAPGKISAALDNGSKISGRIWKRAAVFSRDLRNIPQTMLMLPALNHMIDIVSTREASRKFLVPRIIQWILVIMLILSGFLAGYDADWKRKNLGLIISFSLMTSLSFYLILELDRPRQGFINLGSAEQQIVDLKKMVTDVGR
jgi:hypothetical protein